MPHVFWHTWCGGAGDFVQERMMRMRQHSALGVAVALKPEGFGSLDPKKVEKLRRMIEKDIHCWYEECHKMGLPVHFYPPFPENFDEHPEP